MLDRRSFLAHGAALASLSSPLRAFGAERSLDLALVNANVWTGRPGARETAVGIIGNRIAAVGGDAVRSMTSKSTRIIDLGGAFVMAAFTDNHTHFLTGSVMLTQPNLLDAKDRNDFAARLGAAVRARPGKWILGGSWDEQRMGGQLPTRQWIDAATGDTPVAVPRTDLHSLLLNSVALKLAGIDRNTPDPPGGVIERDAKGEPTGVIKDTAKPLVERVIPAPTQADTEQAIRAGIEHCLSKGVAQVHNPDPFNWDAFEALRRLRAKGETGLRFYAFVPLQDWEKIAKIVAAEGRGDDWLRWGGVKGLADGSLGSRTAVFRDDYTDAPGQHGVRVIALDDLRKYVTAADASKLHVTVHAIGDLANDDVLDLYEQVAAKNGARDRRFRIEHAQHLSAAAIPRFAKQNVIPSVQPYHAIDDGRWAVQRIGPKRLQGTYAFHALLQAGARVTFGSDWPVAPIDPLIGIYAAVTRRTIDDANPNGWQPQEKITIEQALACYTQNNAYAGFMEDRSGRIANGYLADLAVFDADLTKTDPLKLQKVKVLRTFVDGKQRFGESA